MILSVLYILICYERKLMYKFKISCIKLFLLLTLFLSNTFLLSMDTVVQFEMDNLDTCQQLLLAEITKKI